MNESTSRTPLSWPAGRLRTPAAIRKRAQFSVQINKRNGHVARGLVSVADAVNRILTELDKYTKYGHSLRVRDIIISTNLRYKQDGFPYSNQREPEDPGAAVYFTLDGRPYCLPCDKWDRVADNLAAIAAHIAANRGIERWGVGESVDVYAGYTALPAASEVSDSWDCWSVLDIEPTKDTQVINQAYKAKAKDCHPDAGGSDHKMLLLNQARRHAIESIFLTDRIL